MHLRQENTMFRYEIGVDAELRMLQDRHAEELFALVDRNREYLREWLPFLDATTSVEDERDFIKSALERFASDGSFAAGIWFKGKIAGGIGLHAIDWANKKTSIGYWISEDCQGHGLVTRSCVALIDYAINELGLNRVEMHVAPENIKSRAIPERLGFTQEGILRRVAWHYDHYLDLVVYAMLSDEWKNKGSQ